MSKALLGFIAGAGVGAIIGLLFAPNKGSETRKKISKKTDDVTESVKNSVKDVVDQVKSTYSGIMGESEEKVKSARKPNY
jgi:gas vesicle protein